MRIPLVDAQIGKLAPRTLAWYVGLGAMAAFELIEWPVALVVAAGHALATHANQPEVKGVAEGAQAAD